MAGKAAQGLWRLSRMCCLNITSSNAEDGVVHDNASIPNGLGGSPLSNSGTDAEEPSRQEQKSGISTKERRKRRWETSKWMPPQNAATLSGLAPLLSNCFRPVS